MNNFSAFESRLMKQYRLLWFALFGIISINTISMLVLLLSDKYFVLRSGDILTDKPLATDVCLHSFKSIASGSPNKYFVNEKIIEILEDDPFVLKIDKVLRNASVGDNKCRLIIKSGDSVRSFVINLESSDSFPFYYKLFQLDEVEYEEGV